MKQKKSENNWNIRHGAVLCMVSALFLVTGCSTTPEDNNIEGLPATEDTARLDTEQTPVPDDPVSSVESASEQQHALNTATQSEKLETVPENLTDSENLISDPILFDSSNTTDQNEKTGGLSVNQSAQSLSDNGQGPVKTVAGPESVQLLQEQRRESTLKELNQKIALGSFNTTDVDRNLPERESYRVGPEDVLQISVFQVEELNRRVRITGDGFIMIPLLGGVKVGNLTTTEVEQLLTEKLGKDFLHDPQVTVFVDEFRSQQVAVLGAVNEPNIYNIRKPRTILEMLAQAGGLSGKAGQQIQVKRTVQDASESETQLKRESFIIDMDLLLKGDDLLQDITLRGGDSIVVPESGTVFVEGAVKKPGAYDLSGETNVLKALSLAGGILYESKKQNIEIYRESKTGAPQVYSVDYEEIRSDPDQDLALQEGDIIVVRHSSFRRGMANFWKGISGIFNVGYGI